jgi:hypothetical protein
MISLWSNSLTECLSAPLSKNPKMMSRMKMMMRMLSQATGIKSKTEQQQPEILYVATSHAKMIGDMMQETPHPKTSALYWTGSGMSINRVINSTTRRQQNIQGHERVNCLKIVKRHKWVTYLTKQKELTMTDTYNKD